MLLYKWQSLPAVQNAPPGQRWCLTCFVNHCRAGLHCSSRGGQLCLPGVPSAALSRKVRFMWLHTQQVQGADTNSPASKKSDGTLEKVGINSKVGGKAETMPGLLRLWTAPQGNESQSGLVLSFVVPIHAIGAWRLDGSCFDAGYP